MPRETEEDAWPAKADRVPRSYTELFVLSASVVSEPLPLLLLRSKDIDEGARGEGSSSPLVRLDVFQVGVRILAVLASCLVDSTRVFFKIGGGLDEPLLRPFSSSTVGGRGTSGVGVNCLVFLVSSSPLLSSSSLGVTRSKLLTFACLPGVDVA